MIQLKRVFLVFLVLFGCSKIEDGLQMPTPLPAAGGTSSAIDVSQLEGYWHAQSSNPQPNVIIPPQQFTAGKTLIYSSSDRKWAEGNSYVVSGASLIFTDPSNGGSGTWTILKLNGSDFVLSTTKGDYTYTLRYKRLSTAELNALITQLNASP